MSQDVDARRPHGEPSARPPRSGRRALPHRARSVWSALGLTAASVLLPGLGLLYAGRRQAGLAVMGVWLALVAGGAWFLLTHMRNLVTVAVDPERLALVAVACGVLIVVWGALLIATYRLVRPDPLDRTDRVIGRVGVGALCLLVAAPLALAAQYSLVQRDVVTTVFDDEKSATRPVVRDPVEDPWAGTDQVNLLLLGGDGGVDREGIRTDSMIVASMNTRSGDTTLFSVPRNLMNAPFPEDSPLNALYPNGFADPSGAAGESMLNAIYRNVPAQHPGVLGDSENEGADALKQALTGVLGIPVDYYLLVNLNGFEKIVDAMGGVTVNINQQIPIGGDTDRGIPPNDYLEPGPDQHLDGFQALWFSRGRYGLDDYNRMERQRCMVRALIDEADPLTLLRRYRALAEAGKEIVRTDIPQDLLPAFVDLALDIKDGEMSSVVFRLSDKFNPGYPDFDWVHKQVRKALGTAPVSKNEKDQKQQSGQQPKTPSESTEAPEPTDPCDYLPVG